MSSRPERDAMCRAVFPFYFNQKQSKDNDMHQNERKALKLIIISTQQDNSLNTHTQQDQELTLQPNNFSKSYTTLQVA